jgi:hypothetical protein
MTDRYPDRRKGSSPFYWPYFSSLLIIAIICYRFLITYFTATLTKLNAEFRMHYLRLVIRTPFIDLVRAKIATLQAANALIVVY